MGMSSNIKMMDIGRPGVQRISGQTYSSKKERLEIQYRKRQKAKRKRRLKMMHLVIRSFLLLIILVMGRMLVMEIMSSDSLKIKDIKNKEEALSYGVGIPNKFEGNELSAKLKSLTEEYPELAVVYENMDAYPEELILAVCNNPEMIEFVKGYLTADKSATGSFNTKELSTNFPLFLQWDTRWGYASYGESDIALSGCAPTCLSMVIVALTRNADATPSAIADFSESNGYYVAGTGTMWSLMTEGGVNFGVQGQEIGLDKSVIFSRLEEGNPIICSMRPGDFTTSGHFIVLTGIENGKIRVNDPNCIERSNKLWDYEALEHQIKNLWVFTQS